MKKYSIYVASALAALTAFSSCNDSNECGCECNVPIIERVEKLDAPGVNISGSVEAGSYIALFGQNLGDVTSIQFGDRNVAVKEAYRSDNQIIIQVPSITKSCMGTLMTSTCLTGYVMPQLSIVIGTPTVYMMYNEFAADGDYLMLRGSSFVGEQMQVDFVLTDGTIYTAQGEDIKLPATDGSQMNVKVPAGASAQQYLVIRNAAEGKQSICGIMFRDTRNVLVDFDTQIDWTYSTGAIAKTDGIYSMAGLAWYNEVPQLYSVVPGANKFGVFQRASDWEGVLFAPEAGGMEYEEVRSVFGPFKEAVKANPSSASSYLVKFEIRVPESNPTNMFEIGMGFTSASQTIADRIRPFAACLQMSKINWDKSKAEQGWLLESAENFSTFEGKWMTIQVPMSEFMWNLSNGKYITSAQNFTEGKIPDSDKDFFGDPINMLPYVVKYQNRLSDDEDLYTDFGGFSMTFNDVDCPENGSDVNKKAHFAIDNIRIVPDDGNGAYYPKLGWGTPKQHYFEAPRKNAFVAN